MKSILLSLLMAAAVSANAQTFHIDFSKPVPPYSEDTAYGEDDAVLRLTGQRQTDSHSRYFSFKVPDGNYTVTMIIGSKKRAAFTTVRAESRRLLIHNLATRKGEYKTVSFTVNKRSPKIDSERTVAIKEREMHYLTWDDLLTLEITGPAPAVMSIHINRNDSCPTLFLCGNSTVTDQSFEPWASWGQMIPVWFDQNISVSNHAESGLATFSFLASHRLDKIIATMKKGDYVVLEFGHNDQKDKRPGNGAWYNFTYCLKVFIDQVREKGGNIILCTPTQRRVWEKDNKTISNTHGDFPAAVRAIAEREGIPLIDLSAMTKTFYETLGYEDSKRALVHYPAGAFLLWQASKDGYHNQTKAFQDNTHFNPYGAYQVAKMVVMALKNTSHPLTQHLRAEWKDYDPAHPDDWQTFNWTPSPMTELAKPDGN